MAKYLIINTGGTIGMVPGPNGLEPKDGEIERALNSDDPKLAGWQAHDLLWRHWNPLLDSSELQPNHWFELKQQIEQAIEQTPELDGVLIIHGTDTLSYSAAALSFLLSPLNLSVVITGSMLPVSAQDTDAIDNLALSLKALLAGRPEVVICAGGKTLPGSRTSKVSTARFDAFEAAGWQPQHWDAEVERQELVIDQDYRAVDIAVITLYPGIQFHGLTAMLATRPRALIINAFGNGNCASTVEFQQALAQAGELGIPVFVRSQCLEGNVDFGLYAASASFAQAGAISCGNMPFEAVLTKLQILCSQFDDNASVIQLFAQNVAREWQL